MINFKDIKVGATLKLFYNDNNINNRIIHVRAIVDDDFIVTRTWSKNKSNWYYTVEPISWFEVNHKSLSVKP